jgi:hypothetical protein
MFTNRSIASLAFLTLGTALGAISPAQADVLSIMVTEDGEAPFEILDNGPLDADTNEGAITVLTDALNPVLTNFSFSSLRATSNGSLTGGHPRLTISGTVVRATASGLNTSIQIQVTDTSFTDQAATRLRTSATEILINTASGDKLVGQSFFDPTNQPYGTMVPGPIVAGAARGNQAPEIPVALSQEPKPLRLSPPPPAYSLTTEVGVRLGGSAVASDPRTVQFVCVTSVTNS